MAQMPEDVIVVSESGIGSMDQLESLREAGVQAVLVGETLMRAPDPASALRTLLGV
jgi:indole-3-glycerol phosphate synthase